MEDLFIQKSIKFFSVLQVQHLFIYYIRMEIEDYAFNGKKVIKGDMPPRVKKFIESQD
jgi:hypothetical protein